MLSPFLDFFIPFFFFAININFDHTEKCFSPPPFFFFKGTKYFPFNV